MKHTNFTNEITGKYHSDEPLGLFAITAITVFTAVFLATAVLLVADIVFGAEAVTEFIGEVIS